MWIYGLIGLGLWPVLTWACYRDWVRLTRIGDTDDLLAGAVGVGFALALVWPIGLLCLLRDVLHSVAKEPA